MEGFIVLHRKILDWEWYDDPNVFRLFVHGLLRANHKDKMWRGTLIERGQFVSSYDILATELGITKKQIRTAQEKLEKTGEWAHKGTSQHTVFIVKNYDKYQSKGTQKESQEHYEGHSEGTQRATNNNENNENNENNTKHYTQNSDESLPAAEEERKSNVTKLPVVPYQQIVDLYGAILPELPQVVKLTAARKAQIKARWNHDLPTIEDWQQFFQAVRSSKFLMGLEPAGPGRNKPFIASLDWLTKEANLIKVVEGRYHG